MRHYARTATTVASKIQLGGTNKQTEITKLTLTATAAGTVALTDGVSTFTIDVIAGVNAPFYHSLIFAPGADVTITPTGATVSVFAEYLYK